MRKRKNEIFTTIKEDIVNHAKAYFIVVIIFTVGLFLGVLFVNKTENKSEIEKYINSYIDETKQIQNANYFDELQKIIKGNISELENKYRGNESTLRKLHQIQSDINQ